jgi:DNA-binding GntR family transcriptional regulator
MKPGQGRGRLMRGGLEPVRRESTPALIADQLRTGIMNGLFLPGEQLAETQLASQLAVSRGPLREAMQRLVQEGLLHGERNRGLFVVELTAEDVRDIYLAREAVEGAAVRELLAGDTSLALGRLELIAAKMAMAAQSGQWAALADLDLEFHAELVAAAGSPRLQRMMQTLLVETRICQGALEGRYQRDTDLADEHRDILDAIAAGAQEKVLVLLSAHMADAVGRLAGGTSAETMAKPEPV